MKSAIKLSTPPADLITPREAKALAGVNSQEWAYAKRYNPAEFPTNYGGINQYQRFSAAEIAAFFNKYKYQGE